MAKDKAKKAPIYKPQTGFRRKDVVDAGYDDLFEQILVEIERGSGDTRSQPKKNDNDEEAKPNLEVLDFDLFRDYIGTISELITEDFQELHDHWGVTFDTWQKSRTDRKLTKKNVEIIFCAAAQITGTTLLKYLAGYIDHCERLRKSHREKIRGIKNKEVEANHLLKVCGFKKKYHENFTDFDDFINRKAEETNIEKADIYEDIENFVLDDNKSGFFLIESPPKTGKSEVLAKMVKRLMTSQKLTFIWHFNDYTGGINSTFDFLSSIWRQLSDLFVLDEFETDYHAANNNPELIYSFISRILRYISEESLIDQRLLIIVDALDAVKPNDFTRQPHGGNLLGIPSILPDDIYFLISSISFDTQSYHSPVYKHHLLPDKPHGRSQIKLVHGKDTWLDAYNPDAIPFVGRDAEISRLDEFANCADPFKIWAIVAPSGAGKTRLAVHWATKHGTLKDWHCQVLQQEDRKDPTAWSQSLPEKPTLLIVDYMFGFEDVITNLIRRCQKQLPYPVRLLVLDHIFAEPLQNDRRWGFSGSGASLNFNKHLFFSQKALPLTTTDCSIDIMDEIIAHRAKLEINDPEVSKAKRYLEKATGAWQPLFAALVGDAVLRNQDYRAWNRRELVKYCLGTVKSERLPWEHKNGNGKWASCFIAVATALRGVDFSQLINFPYAENILMPDDFDPIIEICRKIVPSSNHTRLQPFEPDLLGESFFLLFIDKLQKLPKIQPAFYQMLIAGDKDTQASDAVEFIGFIQRLSRNLLNDAQNSDETKQFWLALLSFMNPLNFTKGYSIRWAISCGLIEIAEQVKGIWGFDKFRSLLQTVDEDDLYEMVRASPYNPYDPYNAYFYTILIDYPMRLFELKSCFRSESKSSTMDILELYDQHEKPFSIRNTSLCAACGGGFRVVVKAMIRFSADVRAVVKNNRRPLIAAIQGGHVDILETLISYGADIHAVNPHGGATILMEACIHDQIDVVEALIDHHVDIHAKRLDDWTALIVACHCGHATLTEVLIGHGANIYDRSVSGWTTLMAAANNGHMNIVELLCSRDVNIDADIDGCTALLMAVNQSHVEVVQVLIDYHPNLHVKDRNGWTSLMVACEKDCQDIVEILIAADVDVNQTTDMRGEPVTALIVARELGRSTIEKMLIDAGAKS